ncbi:condensation domain-containing protein [Enterobacteriaceae bacterium ESL0689]|nr:condensation domain-containing protein [Enterobacteriaceae bacterium ESL0689]
MSQTLQSSHWLPLTPEQFDFWEEFTFHPHEPVSTVAHCITLRGNINQHALLAALNQVIEETDVFSVQFRLPDGETKPVQCCDLRYSPKVRIIDLQQRTSTQVVARAMMQGDIDGQLNLLRQPLAAVWLICFSPDHYAVYIRAHHIIVDGFGMALIEHRCAELYQAGCQNSASGLPFRSFNDFLHEEHQYAQSEKWQKDRLYWHQQLEKAPPLTVLQKGGENYGTACLHSDVSLPSAFGQQIIALAEYSDTGWPDILLVLSAIWVAKYLPDLQCAGVLPVWVPVMNRRGYIAANTPALAVNILPLFITLHEPETLVALLQRITVALHHMRAHSRYRIETLAADRGIGRGMRYFFSPLINVLPFDPPVFVGCEATREVMASGPGDGFNITWRGRSDGSELHLDIDAEADKFNGIDPDAMSHSLISYLTYLLAEQQWDRLLPGDC